MEPLKKKFGLMTAIAMVVGTVIGSGIFFKAEKILDLTGGSLPLALLSWFLGGLIMVVCTYTFAIMASRYSKINGVVDYAEVSCGIGYGYSVGWFISTIYLPCLCSVIAWLCARYTCVLFNYAPNGPEVMTLAGLYLIVTYSINALSPKLSGKLQVSTTVITLIPLILTAIVGLIVGLKNGITVQNFTTAVRPVNTVTAVFSAVCATVFAYDGWIIATTINSELREPKKTLPKALIFGSLIVIVIYLLYNIGLAGGLTNGQFIKEGEKAAHIAYGNIFGKVGGTTLTVFVIISCLGTLNGAMVGCTRGLYSLAVRKVGAFQNSLSEVSEHTNMPTTSSIFALMVSAFWLMYFYGSQLSPKPWFGVFSFDSSELPIVTLYAMYIPIFFMMMIKEKDLPVFKRFIMPSLSIIGCGVMIYACIVSHGISTLYYLIIYAIIMAIGIVLYQFNKRKSKKKNLKNGQKEN